MHSSLLFVVILPTRALVRPGPFVTRSIRTAIRMTRPVTEPCQKLLMPIRFTPFWMTVIMTAPSIAPTAVPVPPKSEAPPITQAAMAWSIMLPPEVASALLM